MAGETNLGGQEWRLKTPLSPEDISKLSAGDLVYLTGPVYTARDGVYEHMLVNGNPPPIDLASLTNVSFNVASVILERNKRAKGAGFSSPSSKREISESVSEAESVLSR